MTIATPEPSGAQLPTSSLIVPSTATLEQQMHYAEVYSQSGLLPDTFRGKPANVLVAISLAEAMDESLLTITGNLTMVGSKPGWEAKFMRQRARRYGHRIVETFDKATMTATCTIFRADDPKTPITVVMDKARAQLAGWWGKGYWQKDPELMLKNRAVSACVREACNEVLGGVNYEVGELSDASTSGDTSRDWWSEVDEAQAVGQLKTIHSEAHRHGALDDRLRDHIQARKAELVAAASVRRPDIVEAEAVDVETGEIIEPTPAPAVSAGPKPLTRTTGNAILAEFKRLGVERPEVDAWLPALGVPVGLTQLSQPDGEELLGVLKNLDRDRLAELAREAQGQ